MKTKKVVALLPMKANSQRVKGKNFKTLRGKPLFRWILDTLLSVNEIDKIVINTDARSILSEHGLLETERIMIRDRKQEICGDHVSMNKIIFDDINEIDADIYMMTHTTNPFLSHKTIKKALDLFISKSCNSEADSIFTVNKFQTRFYDKHCKAINHDPQNLIPTQELETWYEENSNLYVFTKSSFFKTQARIGQKPGMLISPKVESIDIDDPDDWTFAEITANFLSECP